MKNLCKYLKEVEKVDSIVCSSGGNAGVACAYNCFLLNIVINVFLPIGTKPLMIDRLKQFNAKIHLIGSCWNEADKAAKKYIETKKNIEKIGYASPFDHPKIWEGNSSIIYELAKQIKEQNISPDGLVCSVGGGGLLGGILLGLEKEPLNASLEVFAVETEGTASFHESFKQKKVVVLEKVTGIAHSLGSPRPALKVLEMALKRSEKSNSISSVLVSDKEAVEALTVILDETRFLVEPACSASIAGLKQVSKKLKCSDTATVIVILCGGSAINSTILKSLNNKVLSS